MIEVKISQRASSTTKTCCKNQKCNGEKSRKRVQQQPGFFFGFKRLSSTQKQRELNYKVQIYLSQIMMKEISFRIILSSKKRIKEFKILQSQTQKLRNHNSKNNYRRKQRGHNRHLKIFKMKA